MVENPIKFLKNRKNMYEFNAPEVEAIDWEMWEIDQEPLLQSSVFQYVLSCGCECENIYKYFNTGVFDEDRCLKCMKEK